MSVHPHRNYRKFLSQSVDLDFVFFIFDIKSRIVGHSATAIAAGRPLLPAAPSALVLPAMSPAMAAMLPGATSEAHAGKLTHNIYSMGDHDAQTISTASIFGVVEKSFCGCQKPMLQSAVTSSISHWRKYRLNFIRPFSRSA